MANYIIEALIGGIISLLGYLGASKITSLQDQIDTLKDESNDHYKHSKDLSMHDIERERDAKKLQLMEMNGNLRAHIIEDSSNFNKLESKINAVGDDVKELLQAVARIEGGNHGRQRN